MLDNFVQQLSGKAIETDTLGVDGWKSSEIFFAT
jgi:hypothetical protein